MSIKLNPRCGVPAGRSGVSATWVVSPMLFRMRCVQFVWLSRYCTLLFRSQGGARPLRELPRHRGGSRVRRFARGCAGLDVHAFQHRGDQGKKPSRQGRRASQAVPRIKGATALMAWHVTPVPMPPPCPATKGWGANGVSKRAGGERGARGNECNPARAHRRRRPHVCNLCATIAAAKLAGHTKATANHIHISDTCLSSRAPLTSPGLTTTPTIDAGKRHTHTHTLRTTSLATGTNISAMPLHTATSPPSCRAPSPRASVASLASYVAAGRWCH